MKQYFGFIISKKKNYLVLTVYYKRNLIRKVISTQEILDEEKHGISLAKTNNKVKLTNLCKIIKAIRLSTSKSFKIHRLTVLDLINLLCNDFKYAMPEESQKSKKMGIIDLRLTEIFQCFDLNKTISILEEFFEV